MPSQRDSSPLARYSSPTTSPPSDVKITSSPTTSNASTPPCQTYSDITDPYHALGEHYTQRDRLQNVKPCEVNILSTAHDNGHSVVCIVEIRGITCAMKVHHGQQPVDARYKDYFLDELIAYRHLKNKGFCEAGAVPDIYGVVLSLKPQDWPEWELYYRKQSYMFPANAILLENVEGMHSLTMENYTPERMERWGDLIKQFHAVDLTHGDTYPRNMMFVPAEEGKEERVLWLDFEGGYCGPVGYDGYWENLHRQEREDEAAIMDEFVRFMAIDATEHNGQVVKTGHWWRN